MYERSLARVLGRGRRSVLVLGPRQVGKSTLLSGLAPDWTLNFASPQVFRDYVGHPERLEHELAAAPAATRTIFLDEVQRVPEVLDAVQVAIDREPSRFRFLLSGSSARKLRRGRANLLPGRVQVHHLHPLSATELESDFDLDRALAHGTLPGIYRELDPETRAADLVSYTDSYLREEIQAEALVRNVGGFARLLDLVAAASGRILNVHALSRDAGLGYETARRYLDVMEDTLVACRVPAWTGSDRASLIRHSKLLLFDIGVRNALLRRPLDRAFDDERGLLFEHFVGLELHRRLASFRPPARLHHFRTRHGAEVDFVLSFGSEVWGIEVKSGRRVHSSAFRGLEALAARVPEVTRRIVVFSGPRPQRVGAVEVLPFGHFLDLLPG